MLKLLNTMSVRSKCEINSRPLHFGLTADKISKSLDILGDGIVKSDTESVR